MPLPPSPATAISQAYLAAHGARFAVEPRVSFRQVYLDPAAPGAISTARWRGCSWS